MAPKMKKPVAKDKNKKPTQAERKAMESQRRVSKVNRKKGGGLNTGYLTKMGIHNLIANRSMSFSSISVLTACLLLIGVSFLLMLNIQALVNDVEKQNVIVAFMKDDATDEEISQARIDLYAIPNIAQIDYVSKEEAYKQQLADYGIDEDFFEGVIENPLPDSYRITLDSIDFFDQSLASIKAVNNIQTVRESQEIVDQITTLQKSITMICFILVAVLIVVSLFIISNTIRITMSNRKIDIQVMKSVGATNVFICWPFMIEGVFIGLISGLVSLILTFAFQAGQGNAMQSLFGLFGSTTVSFLDTLPVFVIGYLVAGVFLGSFGSVVSIRKYLKKEGSEANELA